MRIPRTWIKVSATGIFPDGKSFPLSVWGWGEDDASARRNGADRLQRVLERIQRGEPFPEKYGYEDRPLREEILETFKNRASGEPYAIVTRNSQGSRVLNAANLLFLDIDLPTPSIIDFIRQLFGGMSAEEKARRALCDALRNYGRATFRVYRTASGFRAIAIDREFDPTEREVQDLMRATNTDPAYVRLCMAQRSFRARLTPKPWRCNIPPPPGRYPRTDSELQRRFTCWLHDYERASLRYATCRYLETIGNGSPQGDARMLLEFHDRETRCNEALPLA